MSVQRLREALVAAAIPLEVLAGQIRTKPYRELSDEMQAEIARAVLTIRAALVDEPAAATLAEPDADATSTNPETRRGIGAGTGLAQAGAARPGRDENQATSGEHPLSGSASAAADEPGETPCPQG